MVKIAHVVRRLVFEEWGGTETVVWNTVLHQNRTGMEPEILATSALSVPGEEVREGIRIRRFKYFYPYFPMPENARLALDKKGGSPWSPDLFRALAHGGFDLVHIHCAGRLARICEKIAAQCGIPSVITLHGGAADVPPEEMREMLRPLRHKIPYGRFLDLLMRTGGDPVAHADAVICISRTEEERLARKYPGSRIDYLPNGIEAERFQHPDTADVRREYGIPADRKLILCVSRIDYQKNQKILLELLAHAGDTHLLLAGPVTAQWYCAELLEEVKQRNLTDRFTLIPGLPPDSPLLYSAYHSAYAFVLPSRHEPFGIAAQVAWAAGVPLAAARTGGLRDFIRDGENGLFFQPDSAASLLEVWRKMEDPDLRVQLVQNGLKDVRRFSWSALTERLAGIYREVKNEIR